MDDELVAKYAAEAKAAMEAEASRAVWPKSSTLKKKNVCETFVGEIVNTEHFVPALLACLGTRACCS